jgi:hypothetical protein
MKKRLFGLWLMLFFAGVTIGQPIIQFDSAVYTLREIRQGKNASLDAYFQNKGNAPLIIQSAQASIPSASIPDKPILPGERSFIHIAIPGSHYVGLSKYAVSVLSNVSDTPIILMVQVYRVASTPKQVLTGVVTDTSGQPLPFVTVFKLQAHTASQTDTNGVFSIAANYYDTLQFNYVGYYEKQIRVESNNLTVVLEARPALPAVFDDPIPPKRKDLGPVKKVNKRKLKKKGK